MKCPVRHKNKHMVMSLTGEWCPDCGAFKWLIGPRWVFPRYFKTRVKISKLFAEKSKPKATGKLNHRHGRPEPKR